MWLAIKPHIYFGNKFSDRYKYCLGIKYAA